MIILVGPSASGKTEICKALCYKYGFKKFVTTTTRPKRVNEIEDIDYHFITLDQFKENIKNDNFIEYTIYNNNYYGTTKNEISLNTVLILEPDGLKAFNKLNIPSIISFYLECDEETRIKRMKARLDNPKSINDRIKLDRSRFLNLEGYDYKINSEKLSINEITEIIYKTYLNKITSLNNH